MKVLSNKTGKGQSVPGTSSSEACSCGRAHGQPHEEKVANQNIGQI